MLLKQKHASDPRLTLNYTRFLIKLQLNWNRQKWSYFRRLKDASSRDFRNYLPPKWQVFFCTCCSHAMFSQPGKFLLLFIMWQVTLASHLPTADIISGILSSIVQGGKGGGGYIKEIYSNYGAPSPAWLASISWEGNWDVSSIFWTSKDFQYGPPLSPALQAR